MLLNLLIKNFTLTEKEICHICQYCIITEKIDGLWHLLVAVMEHNYLRSPEMFSLSSLNSVTKIFVITVKGFEPAASCVRDQDAITVPA